MKKTKVIEIVSGINFGGVESFLYSYFSNMNLDNYEIIMVTHDTPNLNNQRMFEKLGIKILKVTPKRESLLKNLKELHHIFKQEKPDIVHAHMTLSNWASLLIAKKLNVKTRISHSHLALNNKSFKEKIYSKLTCMYANIYVACTVDAAGYLYGKKNITKTIIIKNAFDTKKFKYDEERRKKIRNNLNLKDEIVIGNVGRFSEQKNHKRIIEIFNYYLTINNNSVLLLIGSGEDKEKIVGLIKSYNIDDKVIFLGNKTNIEDYYQAMDIFLFPSLYEGLGIVLIEAQISGLPCIVSDVIPIESKVSDLITYLNLNDDNSTWTKKFKKNKFRNKYSNCADGFGYKIDDAVINLENLYSSRSKL